MAGLAALSFLAPLALLGLVALPALWWLLRATPPQPTATPFPPLRLLVGLADEDQTPVRTPWWLLALRLALLTLIILAFAGPVWRASDQITLPGGADQPLLVVFETDWASAADWQTQIEKVERIIETADAQDRPVGILAAPQPSIATVLPGDRTQALASLSSLEPQPTRQDEAALRASVDVTLSNPAWTDAALLWLPSGLQHSVETQSWFVDLAETRDLAFINVSTPAYALSLSTGADGPAVEITSIGDRETPTSQQVTAFDEAGRQLAQTIPLAADGTLLPRVNFDLPLDVRNDIARIALVPTSHVGEVVLVDDRQERRLVGIVGAERREQAQPLLSGTTYVERAMRPFADVVVPRSGDTAAEIEAMIEEGVSVIVLVDVASLIPSTVTRLEPWIESGGVLVRFASTSLTQSQDSLVPVPLRAVDRQLGGALTWDEPQAIAPFAQDSPFAGLTIASDVKIERQVLSEPGAAIAARTFAELSDATPLVTGQQRGDGHLVLFHITADTRWSNLPLSGLFVDMLQRLTLLSATDLAAPSTLSNPTETALSPRITLDAFGRLGSPPSFAEGLMLQADDLEPTLVNPPGFYGPADAQRALNLFASPPDLAAFDAEAFGTSGSQSLDIGRDESVSLRPVLLTLAVLLALLDAIAVLAISGAFAGLKIGKRAVTASAFLFALGLIVSAATVPAMAQNSADTSAQSLNDRSISRLLAAANTTRFAYVLTGDAEIDQRSRQGMSGISRILTQRTAFEPGEPFAVDPTTDELAFYPLIYWPMPSAPIAVSDQLITRIDAYMNNGGTILFDTRDEASNFASAAISPQTANLRTLLGALDIPPLVPVPDDHVLTKAFYLLDSFPGRFASGPLWVEALPEDEDGVDRPARGGDGVTPIMITGNDLASAWALSPDGRPLYATTPPDRVQRELAFRTGVNIAMYVMTGNYKADQVHIPALLERLVQ